MQVLQAIGKYILKFIIGVIVAYVAAYLIKYIITSNTDNITNALIITNSDTDTTSTNNI